MDVTGSSRIDLPEFPPLLQERIAHELVECGPIHGAVKAKLVAEKILVLMMQHYMAEAEAENGDG
jgi:hypothetical protein